MFRKKAFRSPATGLALLAAGALALTACGSGASDGAAGSGKDYGTVEDGVISVAYMQGLMPYIGEEHGELVGAEGEMFRVAAAELGMEVEHHGMEFAALLAGVQAGRYDIAVGGVSWKTDRAATGVMTDPVFYSPVVALSKPGVVVTDVPSLSGLAVGALAGTTSESALRTISAVRLSSYPTSAAAFADLEAGRLDSLIIDPLLNAYMKQTRPDLTDFVLSTLAPPTQADFDANPGLADGGLEPYQVVWYCSPRAKALCDALDPIIVRWYADGTSADILSKYGVTDPAFFTARDAFSEVRRGADRPADWTAPTAGSTAQGPGTGGGEVTGPTG